MEPTDLPPMPNSVAERDDAEQVWAAFHSVRWAKPWKMRDVEAFLLGWDLRLDQLGGTGALGVPETDLRH